LNRLKILKTGFQTEPKKIRLFFFPSFFGRGGIVNNQKCIIRKHYISKNFFKALDLSHYSPTMPFGNRQKYFRGAFKFSIVTIQRISPPWKPEIELFRHFPKLKIAYFNGKNPFNF